MKKVILLIICLLPVALFAQSAEDYFHNAANFYVNDNKKSAQSIIREGIQRFPNDQKLRNLAAIIEELPEPEDQNEQDQQNQPEDQDDNEQNQDQNNENRQQQQQQEPSISREDAERILNSLSNEDREVQERVRLEQAAQERRNSVRNW